MKRYKSYIDKVSLVREPTEIKRAKIACSDDANAFAREFWDNDIDIQETAHAILLNAANNTVGYVFLSKGGIMGTIIDQRLIVKYALDCLATCVILVHNHPSERAYPSEADKKITKDIKSALNLMNIQLHDHLIITKDSYYSMADEGDM